MSNCAPVGASSVGDGWRFYRGESNRHHSPSLSFNSPSSETLPHDLLHQDSSSTIQVAELSPYPELALPGRKYYCCTTENDQIYCTEMLNIKTVTVIPNEDRADTACYGEVWDCPVEITTSFGTDCLRRDSHQTKNVLELLELYSFQALV